MESRAVPVPPVEATQTPPKVFQHASDPQPKTIFGSPVFVSADVDSQLESHFSPQRIAPQPPPMELSGGSASERGQSTSNQEPAAHSEASFFFPWFESNRSDGGCYPDIDATASEATSSITGFGPKCEGEGRTAAGAKEANACEFRAPVDVGDGFLVEGSSVSASGPRHTEIASIPRDNTLSASRPVQANEMTPPAQTRPSSLADGVSNRSAASGSALHGNVGIGNGRTGALAEVVGQIGMLRGSSVATGSTARPVEYKFPLAVSNASVYHNCVGRRHDLRPQYLLTHRSPDDATYTTVDLRQQR